MSVRPIPLSRLLPAKDSRRSPGDIDELAASIAEVGLLNPLCVVEGVDEDTGEVGNSWLVVAGRRRLAALKRLHAEDPAFEVPCTILPEELAAVASGTENLVRLNLDVLEEADAFRLMADAGHEVSRIAAMFACPPVRVRQRLQVANAAEPWRHWYRERIIRIEDLQKVAALDEGRQLELAARCSTRSENYKAHPSAILDQMGRRIPAKHAKFDVEPYDHQLVHDFFDQGSPFMDGPLFFELQRKWLLDFEATETTKGGLCAVVDHTQGYDKRPHWYHDVQWHAKEHRPKRGSARKGYVTILELHADGRVEQTTVDREWFGGIKERQEKHEAGKHARAKEDAAVIAAAKAEQGGVRTKVFEELLDDYGLCATAEMALHSGMATKAAFLSAYARGAFTVRARKLDVPLSPAGDGDWLFPKLRSVHERVKENGRRVVIGDVDRTLDEAVVAAFLEIDRYSPALTIARDLGVQPVWSMPYQLLSRLPAGILVKLAKHYDVTDAGKKAELAERLARKGHELLKTELRGVLMPEWRDVASAPVAPRWDDVGEVGPGADELPDGPEDVSLVGAAGAADEPSVPPDPDGLDAGAVDEVLEPVDGTSFADDETLEVVVPIARGRKKMRSPRAA